MPRSNVNPEQREATFILGETAAGRLYSLVQERLEELRAQGPFTQADIAARLGTSEQLVSRWLTEPRNMTVRSAGRLLAALDAHLLFELDRFEDIAASAGQGNGAVSHLALPRLQGETAAKTAVPEVTTSGVFNTSARPASA